MKVAIEMLDAVSGGRWRDGLHDDPQDYVVCPPQLSLDGVYVDRGFARQFLPPERATTRATNPFAPAMRIVVYDAKQGHSSERQASLSRQTPEVLYSFGEIGIPPSSLVEQRILSDPHGIASWDPEHFASLFVYWLGPDNYREVTGDEPPRPADESQGYQGYRLP